MVITTANLELEEKWKLFRKKFYVHLIFYSLSTVTFEVAFAAAWPSPCLPRLEGRDGPESNPLKVPITLHESSWLASVSFLGAILGNLLTGSVMPFLGRRMTLIVLLLPAIFAYMTFGFCTNLIAFFIARTFCGISAGGIAQIIPIYIGELAPKESRGALFSCYPIFMNVGVLYVYVAGPLLSFRVFNLANLCFPVISCILLMTVVVESPYRYVEQGKVAEARAVLTKLRPGNSSREVEEELEQIATYIQRQQTDEITFGEFFQSRPLKRSMIVSVGLVIFVELAMINVIMAYMETILSAVGGGLSPQMSSVYLILITLAGSVAIPHIIDRFSRKILLLSSDAMVTQCIAVLGVYFYLKYETDHNVDSFSWLVLATLIVYGFFFGLSYSLTYVIIGEIFPQSGKNVAATITMALNNVGAFAMVYIYPLIESQIGAGCTFWMFAVLFSFSIVFNLIVPETKGKSLAEIQTIFEK